MKAVIRHSLTVYNALLEEATSETIEGQDLKIYRGPVSKMYATLGIGSTYYSDIFKQLELQGCLTYLQRGSKGVDTVIVLHYPPSEDGFQIRRKKDLTSAEKFANLIETVLKNDELLGGIDIAEALRAMEERVQRLEDAEAQRVNMLKPKGNTN